MFWQTDDEIQALSDWRAVMRKERQLRKELLEFEQIAHHTEDRREFKWALQMIKSIKHELHELLH